MRFGQSSVAVLCGGLGSASLVAAALVATACGAEFTAASSHDDAGIRAASGGAESGGASGLPGSGGTKNKGGAAGSGGGDGSGGASSTGGVASAGGTVGAGGAVGVGGASSSGGRVGSGGGPSSGGNPNPGGSVGTGGLLGSGGITALPPPCTPGALECDHVPPRVCTNAGVWQTRAVCGPLMASDVVSMDASGLPGFNAPGFRCKSLAVCGISQACGYYPATANLGSLESAETTYTDGAVLAAPQALWLYLAGGAASQCMNPDIDISAGETLLLKLSTGVTVRVYFPKFSGNALKLYIREDGATFTDAALTMKARGPG